MTDLQHSQAEIIAKAFLDAGFGTDPETDMTLPLFSISMPQEIDECMGVFNTQGVADPKTSRGDRVDHPGIQLACRSPDATKAHNLNEQGSNLLDTFLRRTVVLGTQTYMIISTTRTSKLAAGQDPENRRQLFTTNAIVTIENQTP